MSAKTTRFGDLLETPLRSGFTAPSATRGAGIRMLNMGELFGHRRIGDLDMVRVEMPKATEERALLRRGDLVFARRSLSYTGAGRCSIIAEVTESTTWESSIIRARVNRNLANPEYLFYYFRSSIGRRQMETIIEQVAAAGIRLSDLVRLPVPTPSLPDQTAIAEVLSVLDDKISANGKTVGDLDLFATEIYNNAARGGPDRALSSLASFVNGGAHTKGASGTGRVVVRIAELNGGIGGSTVFSDAEVPEEQTARFGDLLFAWSGSLTIHRWYRDDAIINQHIFKVLPKDENSHWLIHQALLSALPSLKAIAADKATTMGHIKREHLDILVRVPDTETTARISLLLQGAWDLALSTEQESLRLIALRDTLLPALMSGRLRVKDAERAVEDVL